MHHPNQLPILQDDFREFIKGLIKGKSWRPNILSTIDPLAKTGKEETRRWRVLDQVALHIPRDEGRKLSYAMEQM